MCLRIIGFRRATQKDPKQTVKGQDAKETTKPKPRRQAK